MAKEIRTPQSRLDHVRSLQGTDLAMEFMRTSNIAYVSPAPGFFAVANPKTNEILIFGAEKGTVRSVSFENDLLLFPFNTAQLSDFEFTARDGKVACDVGGGLGAIEEKTFIEAAMKALILAITEHRLHRSKKLEE